LNAFVVLQNRCSLSHRAFPVPVLLRFKAQSPYPG
jgi:hypothetical protein